ncbi:carboxypeptidase-like regulatory domain-containing protein, partial [Roseisolibacter sp. H3M3-2]|uniref:carboxypeptidase-like regulatory domain-containing protein n=1 Tax=Roseisolibacter sp. H3M3-2 TaxID=3031323 RepID=UPI0023DA5F85
VAAERRDGREARAPWFDVWLDAALPLRHLTLAPAGAAPRVALRGLVRDSLGQPVANARVRVADPEAPDDSLAATVRTAADGTFRFASLPEGTALVEATAVGHLPARAQVALLAEDANEVALVLRRGTVLAAAVTTERFTEAFLAEVEQRKLLGVGTIRTSEVLERYPQVSSTLRDIPGVRVEHGMGNRWRVRLTRTNPPFGCEPQIYLDGLLLNPERASGRADPDATDMLQVLAPTDLVAIEVYHNGASAPQRYASGMSRCGVMLVWTKAYARMPVR